MAHDAHEHHQLPLNGDDLPPHGHLHAEPESPSWLPFLGAALGGLLLIFWLASPSAADEAKAAAAAAASASASAAAAASASAPAGQ